MRMMPLDVMMPTTGQLTLTLPPSAVGGKSHNPFGSLTTIAGIKDEVIVMPSLQKPKKVNHRQHAFLLPQSHLIDSIYMLQK